ncbi:acriflavin resistance protein [Desulfovibrio sp. X2]|uniref:efflux RND transporter permease subunit n=1 Tax=Desulfovibrio sp. X2 TaxID=941449 RepID=UPI000358742D|nr:efflux RND transporter permease subunit [Desulfovibrio sp. X2]EPR44679.1 acriflavin resistance protein [Desulfovibrio sp. X2]
MPSEERPPQGTPGDGAPNPPAGHAQSAAGRLIGTVVAAFLESRLSLLLLIFSLLVGIIAVRATPKEEEPQIVVPLADVSVSVPGASAEEVEKLVTTPLERILWQIDGVEYVYSVSRRDQALATVRFYVGENREDALVRLHNAITRNLDLVPPVVHGWTVKNVEVDDVPIVLLTLSSPKLSDYELTRIAEEMVPRLAEIPDVSLVQLAAARPREVRVELSPERMAGFGVTALEVRDALAGADAAVTAGDLTRADKELRVTANSFIMNAAEAGSVVVAVHDDRPVTLSDVGRVVDGPAEPDAYSRHAFSLRVAAERGAGHEDDSRSLPSVTIAVSKKRGSNAVTVAKAVRERAEELRADVLPSGVELTVTRDYGETAHAKVSDLLSSLGFAIATVVLLLVLTMGWRESLVVAVSVPVSFSLALGVNYLLGYSINRVTLFALILSLGLVVDDPITNVDNIQRHIRLNPGEPRRAALAAVAEVLPPVIMSSLAVIVSFLPLYFITGMMGPYMAPMAANVPLTVTFSTVASLTVVPWLAYLLLKDRAMRPVSEGARAGGGANPVVRRLYERAVLPFLESRGRRRALWLVILGLLVVSVSLPLLRLVPLKMLPFDNKNELQLVIDMDEGTPLEATDRCVRAFEEYLRGVNEVRDVTTFAGTASPVDFNGLVRQYYLRRGGNVADIRITLADKSRRAEQSHAIALRLRRDLTAIATKFGARLKIVETPPGPPVVATLVAEVYAEPGISYGRQLAGAFQVEDMMRGQPLVVDVDDSAETERDRLDFVLDKTKAALHSVTAEDVAATLSLALSGAAPAMVHEPYERQPLYLRLVLPRSRMADVTELERLPLRGKGGEIVPLGELGRFEKVPEDQPILHKNLRRVAYVFGDTAGRPPGEAVLDMQSYLRAHPLPQGLTAEWAGEGEWKITLDVFRDLGIAFAAALVCIWVLLVIETGSLGLPVLLMSAIPLTLLGIMPGFFFLNLVAGRTVDGFPDPVFFTATSMIGMIALGGIVIRNSVVLIEFVKDELAQGTPLREAIVRSGSVRLRPIVLTAATTALGAWPITLDPIFSGLAWALIFGIAASTLFSLLVVPVAYYAVYGKEAEEGPGSGGGESAV